MSHPAQLQYWVRHGESGWNAAGLIQGQAPTAPGLTAAGRAQAAALAEAMTAVPASLVISSDLARALETAEAVAGALRVPLEVDPRLRERCLGEAEGSPASSWRGRLGFVGERVTDPDARAPLGESIRELYERVSAVIETVSHRGDGPVVLVTHGGVIKTALALFAGETPEEMSWPRTGNACAWEVSITENGAAVSPFQTGAGL